LLAQVVAAGLEVPEKTPPCDKLIRNNNSPIIPTSALLPAPRVTAIVIEHTGASQDEE
jgi:hypothetical protein